MLSDKCYREKKEGNRKLWNVLFLERGKELFLNKILEGAEGQSKEKV